MPIASVASNDSTAGNVSTMATLTICNLDDAMEQEVRQILRQVVKPADTAAKSEGLGSRIHNHFALPIGTASRLPPILESLINSI